MKRRIGCLDGAGRGICQSADLQPLELASAYATVANGGVWVEPYWIEKVERRDGKDVISRREGPPAPQSSWTSCRANHARM